MPCNLLERLETKDVSFRNSKWSTEKCLELLYAILPPLRTHPFAVLHPCRICRQAAAVAISTSPSPRVSSCPGASTTTTSSFAKARRHLLGHGNGETHHERRFGAQRVANREALHGRLRLLSIRTPLKLPPKLIDIVVATNSSLAHQDMTFHRECTTCREACKRMREAGLARTSAAH